MRRGVVTEGTVPRTPPAGFHREHIAEIQEALLVVAAEIQEIQPGKTQAVELGPLGGRPGIEDRILSPVPDPLRDRRLTGLQRSQDLRERVFRFAGHHEVDAGIAYRALRSESGVYPPPHHRDTLVRGLHVTGYLKRVFRLLTRQGGEAHGRRVLPQATVQGAFPTGHPLVHQHKLDEVHVPGRGQERKRNVLGNAVVEPHPGVNQDHKAACAQGRFSFPSSASSHPANRSATRCTTSSGMPSYRGSWITVSNARVA